MIKNHAVDEKKQIPRDVMIINEINTTIRGIEMGLWQKFRKLCIDEIDPVTQRSVSVNTKLKQLIRIYVEQKEKENKNV